MCSNQLSYVATKSLRLRSGAYYADLGFCRQPFYDIKRSVWLDTKQVVTNFLFAMGKIAELSSVNRSLLIAEAANYL
jgi:hypothetical protein